MPESAGEGNRKVAPGMMENGDDSRARRNLHPNRAMLIIEVLQARLTTATVRIRLLRSLFHLGPALDFRGLGPRRPPLAQAQSVVFSAGASDSASPIQPDHWL